jgi:hypothetical protein
MVVLLNKLGAGTQPEAVLLAAREDSPGSYLETSTMSRC